MKGRPSVGFIYQAVTLLLVVVTVHAAYVALVWPRASIVEAEQQARVAADRTYVPAPSLWVILRDYEQEAEIILMLWAMALLAHKAYEVSRERVLLRTDLVSIAEGESVLPEDAREHSRALEALPEPQRSYLYPRALLTALQRFRATGNIHDVSNAVSNICRVESERMDSELAMIRYIAWAIPSIGFIGTVRGISQAMSLAHKAVEGDISGVTANLGLAFNSTFVALALSLILMFALHQLQRVQERLVLDTETACDRHLIQNLQNR